VANQVLDAIRERRSTRKFLDKPVPKEVVEQLLSAAVYSPSAMHKEPWRFVVISDRKKIKELSDAAKRLYASAGMPAKYLERMQSKEDTMFHGAPLLILVFADRKTTRWVDVDCGILAQTLFLAAQSLGLGSCFIGLAQSLNKDAGILRELGMPEGYELVAPLIFGYPAEKIPVHERSWKEKVLGWI